MDRNANIQRFEELMSSVKRAGVDKLMDYIKKSDFYTAPASTKYHLSCEGGLLQHSLNVFDCLSELVKMEPLKSRIQNVSGESLILVALLHDICKTNFYKVSTRNVKNENTGQWEKVPFYAIDDKIPYGHGEKSVMMIESYIRLGNAERYAIRWHMGAYEPKEYYPALGTAMERYPLLLALIMADMTASNVIEDTFDNKPLPPKSEMDFEVCK